MAYCLDQAVGYFGSYVENELEKATHKPGKEERKAEAARKAVFDRLMDTPKNTKGKFADPALLFK